MQLETSAKPITFTVSGGQPLLLRAIGLLIADCQPGACVAGGDEHCNGYERDFLRIDYGESGRWMAVLTGDEPASQVIGALRNGAACFATVDGTVADFNRSLQSLIDGTDAGVPAALARHWLLPESPKPVEVPPREASPSLTAREREVLSRVASGLSNQRIAADLSISVHTVRTHLSSMSAKLGAANRVHLVRLAARLGYPEADLAAARQPA